MSKRMIPAGLIPAASQRIRLANSTAVALNSTVRAANPSVLLFSVETNGARMSISSVPTLTTGVLYPVAGSPYTLDGYNGSASLKFQRDTGVSVVNVQAFKRPGA